MPNEIAIVGGGPAGCAAALTLRRYLPHVSVTLVSKSPHGAEVPSVGETLSPGALPLLDYIGLREQFLSLGHLPSCGTASVWGSDRRVDRYYLFTGRGHGWHLDRSRFDAWLFSNAEQSGAHCVESRVVSVVRFGRSWRMELERGDELFADVIVEATGRSKGLLHDHGSVMRRDDALVAEARWFSHGQDEIFSDGALVESVSDGWWYSASLPGGRGIAMFMTDSNLRKERSWEDRLAFGGATKRRIQPWRETGQAVVRPANSQCCKRAAGEGWVAAGDAAATFDPISALGIGFALRSGMEAARVAAAHLDRDDAAANAYEVSVLRIYADYRARLRGIYGLEKRWTESPFWSRRQIPEPA